MKIAEEQQVEIGRLYGWHRFQTWCYNFFRLTREEFSKRHVECLRDPGEVDQGKIALATLNSAYVCWMHSRLLSKDLLRPAAKTP